MKKKVYNWGIIGLGKIARKFATDLKVLPNAKLHAVASRSAEKAKEFASEFEAFYYYGSYESMMDCPGLDVVYIATPHVFHYQNTLLCLENKIPVLCEKPFAMNGHEVENMIRGAILKKTFLMEAMWTRFLPTTEKLLELIEADTIGKVRSVKADFGFEAPFSPFSRLYDNELGGGALMDIGIYPVFLSLLLLGKPTVIKATAKIGRTKVDESCGIMLKYAAGQMALLHATILHKTETEAYIYGEKGMIKIHGRWHEATSLTLYVEGKEPKDFFFNFESKGYSYEAREVMKCLSEGKLQSDRMGWKFSRDLMNLLEAIRMRAGIYYNEDEKSHKRVGGDQKDFNI